MKIPVNSLTFGILMTISVGLGLSISNSLLPIIAIVGFTSYIWFKYSTASKRNKYLLVREYLQETNVSSDELAQQTDVSPLKIEFIRSNCEISVDDIDKIIDNLGLAREKQRHSRSILRSALLIVLGIIMVVCFVYFIFGDNQ